MRTAPAARRRGVAGRLLDHVLAVAQRARLHEDQPRDRHPGLLRARPRAVRIPGLRGVRAVRVVRPGSAQRVLLKSPSLTLRSSSVRRMRTPRIAAVATLLALSLLTACGGDGDDDSDSSDDKTTVTVTETPTETTSAPTETTPTTETSVTPMDPTDGDITQEQVEAALLTPGGGLPGLRRSAPTPTSPPRRCATRTGRRSTRPSRRRSRAAPRSTTPTATPRCRRRSRSTPPRPRPPRRSRSRSPDLACAEGTVDGSPVTIGAAAGRDRPGQQQQRDRRLDRVGGLHRQASTA